MINHIKTNAKSGFLYGINIPENIRTTENKKKRKALFTQFLISLSKAPSSTASEGPSSALEFEKRAVIKGLRHWGAETLADGLSHCAKSIIIEPNYICKDHNNLYSEYLSKKFSHYRKLTTRLHFFDADIPDEGELVSQHLTNLARNNSYIGYSIIRDHNRSLGRSVFNPQKTRGSQAKNCHFLTTTFKVQMNGVEFSISGYPYMSQDGEVIWCAHVALWGIIRYLSQAHSKYAETYPFDIVKLGTGHRRNFPTEGLSFEAASLVLKRSGANPHLGKCKNASTDKNITQEGVQQIYAYIESGVPVLVTVPNHAFTIIGHTLDLSAIGTFPINDKVYKKIDCVRFYDSSSFIPSFIITDDNRFPYKTISTHLFKDDGNDLAPYKNSEDFKKASRKDPKLAKMKQDSMYTLDSIQSFICPLPEKVFTSVETVRESFFNSIKMFLADIPSEDCIFRLFFTSSNAYKKHKQKKLTYSDGQVNDSLDELICSLCLPHFIWICELSTPAQYKTKKVFGEFVFNATDKDHSSALLFSRMESNLHFPVQSGKNRLKEGSVKEYDNFRQNLR